MTLDRLAPMDDIEETVAIIDATVTLATHALDGAGLSDEELDILCDAVLSRETGAGDT